MTLHCGSDPIYFLLKYAATSENVASCRDACFLFRKRLRSQTEVTPAVNALCALLLDHSDGYAHPQGGECLALQQRSHVPESPLLQGALSQRWPLQTSAGHLQLRMPQRLLRAALPEQ